MGNAYTLVIDNQGISENAKLIPYQTRWCTVERITQNRQDGTVEVLVDCVYTASISVSLMAFDWA